MKISDWRPMQRGSLLGFATVEMPSGLIVHDVPINRSGESTWASPPGKPRLDRDKKPVIENGKVRYDKVLGFRDRDVRDRWSEAVIAELSALGHI